MSRIRSLRSVFIVVVVSVVAVGTGCGSEASSPVAAGDAATDITELRPSDGPAPDQESPGAQTYVGEVEGTDAYISVSVAGDGTVVAYLCDGAALVEYLDGTVRGDGVVEASEPFGTFVSAELDGDEMAGSVTLPDGSAHRFSASEPEGPAGVFWLEERPDQETVVLGGWIRLEDGSVRGKVQTISVGSEPGITDGSSNTADGGGPIPPQAEPTGIIQDFRCGRILRKQVQAAEVYRQATPGPDPGFHTPDQDAAYNDLLALERQAEAIGCVPNPGTLLVA